MPRRALPRLSVAIEHTLNKTQKAKVVNDMIDLVRDQANWTPKVLEDGSKVRWGWEFTQSMLEAAIASAIDVKQISVDDVCDDDVKEIIGGYMPLVKITRGVEWVDDEE